MDPLYLSLLSGSGRSDSSRVGSFGCEPGPDGLDRQRITCVGPSLLPGVPLFVWFRGRRLSLPRSLVSSRSPCFIASSVDSPERNWPPSGPLCLVNTLGQYPEGEIAAPIVPDRVLVGLIVLAPVVVLAIVVSLLTAWHREALKLVMDPECAPGDDNKRLVLPGGVVDGQFVTQEYDILKLKKDELKELCRSYGLNQSGNKDILQSRLRAFSADQNDWTRLNPEPRRMHRGPKTGKTTKAKSVKHSVRRANEVFRSHTNTHAPHLLYRLPEQEPAVSQTQGNALYEWAKGFSTAHPYVSKEDRIKAGEARLRKQALAQHYIIYPTLSQQTHATTSFTSPFLSFNNITPNHNVLDSNPPLSLHTISADNTSIAPAASALHPSISESMVANSPASFTRSMSQSQQTPTTRTLKLANGTVIEFTEDEAGPPPALSFANDLPGLNRMWDDRSESWDGQSALIIKGIPIPIVYWREVYGRVKSEIPGRSWRVGDWKKIKGTWSEWKMIILRWRQSSEANFWKEFSDSQGDRLNYKAIVKCLTQIRMNEDQKLANEARTHYSTHFDSVFCYKKSGIVHVKTKDSDIAKQYRQELAKLNPPVDGMELESD